MLPHVQQHPEGGRVVGLSVMMMDGSHRSALSMRGTFAWWAPVPWPLHLCLWPLPSMGPHLPPSTCILSKAHASRHSSCSFRRCCATLRLTAELRYRMAPEVIMDEKCSYKADVYSLGECTRLAPCLQQKRQAPVHAGNGLSRLHAAK